MKISKTIQDRLFILSGASILLLKFFGIRPRSQEIKESAKVLEQSKTL